MWERSMSRKTKGQRSSDSLLRIRPLCEGCLDRPWSWVIPSMPLGPWTAFEFVLTKTSPYPLLLHPQAVQTTLRPPSSASQCLPSLPGWLVVRLPSHPPRTGLLPSSVPFYSFCVRYLGSPFKLILYRISDFKTFLFWQDPGSPLLTGSLRGGGLICWLLHQCRFRSCRGEGDAGWVVGENSPS